MKQIRQHDRKLIKAIDFLILLASLFSQAGANLQCRCASGNTLTYEAQCSSGLLAIRRPIIGRTRDTSDSSFCSRQVSIVPGDCAVIDDANSYNLRTRCNARSNSCSVNFNLDTQLISCGANNGHIYTCLEFECINNNDANGQPVIHASMVSTGPVNYYPNGRFQMMTSSYANPTQEVNNFCLISLKASSSIILKFQDLRGRHYQTPNNCVYRLTVSSPVDNQQWCAADQWSYIEHAVHAGGRDMDVYVRFDSLFPRQQAEGAAWITIEANSPENVVTCGRAPEGQTTTSSTTTTTTTTRAPPAGTTTTTRPPIGPTTTTSLAPGRTTTPTTQPPLGPTTTTTPRVNPPGPTTTTPGRPGGATTTTRGNPGVPTTTTRGNPDVPTTTTRENPAATTTTSSSRPGGTTTSSRTQRPGVSTTVESSITGRSTGTTRLLSNETRSPTPGLMSPTPGLAGLRSDKLSSFSDMETVAITVAVILGGLIIITVVIAAICWATRRNKDPKLVSHEESYEATLE